MLLAFCLRSPWSVELEPLVKMGTDDNVKGDFQALEVNSCLGALSKSDEAIYVEKLRGHDDSTDRRKQGGILQLDLAGTPEREVGDAEDVETNVGTQNSESAEQETRSGEGPLMCKLCNKEFASGRALGGHMHTHRGATFRGSSMHVEGSVRCSCTACESKSSSPIRPASSRSRSVRHSALTDVQESCKHTASKPGALQADSSWGLKREHVEVEGSGGNLASARKSVKEGVEGLVLQYSVKKEQEEALQDVVEEDRGKLDGTIEKIYVCKFCSRHFPSGRALGGHIRMHNIPNEDTAKGSQGGSPASLSGDDSHSTASGHPSEKKNGKVFYASEEIDLKGAGDYELGSAAVLNYQDGRRTFQCRSCLREFDSGRALGGHMKTHRIGSGESDKGSQGSLEDQDGEDGPAWEQEKRFAGSSLDGSQSEAEEEVLEGPAAKAHAYDGGGKEAGSKRPAMSSDGLAAAKKQRKPKRTKWLQGIPLAFPDPGSSPPPPKDGAHQKMSQPSGSRSCVCTECGRSFSSWKALFGHMRCHPEREWRGIQRPSLPGTVTTSVTKVRSGAKRRAGEKQHPAVEAKGVGIEEAAAPMVADRPVAEGLELASDTESLESIEDRYVNKDKHTVAGAWMRGKRSKRRRVALRAIQIPPHLLARGKEVETPVEIRQERQDRDMADWLVLLASAVGEGEEAVLLDHPEDEPGAEAEDESRTEGDELEVESDNKLDASSEDEEVSDGGEKDGRTGSEVRLGRSREGKQVAEGHELSRIGAGKVARGEEEVQGNWVASRGGKSASKMEGHELPRGQSPGGSAMENVEEKTAADSQEQVRGAMMQARKESSDAPPFDGTKNGAPSGAADASKPAGDLVSAGETMAAAAEEEDFGTPNALLSGSRYVCTTCHKVFKSHQALGGHRASHRKVKKPAWPANMLNEVSGSDTPEEKGVGDSSVAPRWSPSLNKTGGVSQEVLSAPSSAALSGLAVQTQARIPEVVQAAGSRMNLEDILVCDEHDVHEQPEKGAFAEPMDRSREHSAIRHGRPVAPAKLPLSDKMVANSVVVNPAPDAGRTPELGDEGSSLRTDNAPACGGASAEQRGAATGSLNVGDKKGDRLEDEVSEGGSTGEFAAVAKASKAHACSICQRVFSSGQALGGHKRCHWAGTSFGPEGTSASPEPSSISIESTPAGSEGQPRNLAGPALCRETGQPPEARGSNELDLNLPAPEEDALGITKGTLRAPPIRAWQNLDTPVVPHPLGTDNQHAQSSLSEKNGLACTAGSSSGSGTMQMQMQMGHAPGNRVSPAQPSAAGAQECAPLRPEIRQASANYLGGLWMRPHAPNQRLAQGEVTAVHSSPYGAIRSVLPSHILASLGIREDDLNGLGLQWMAADALKGAGALTAAKEGFQRVRAQEVSPPLSLLPRRLDNAPQGHFFGAGATLSSQAGLVAGPGSTLPAGWHPGLLADISGSLRPGMQQSLNSRPTMGFHSGGMSAAANHQAGLLLGQAMMAHAGAGSPGPGGIRPQVEESRPMEASLGGR